MFIGELGASTPGIVPDDIAHLIVPGRGRSEDGMGLSLRGEARVDVAAAFYTELGLAEKYGVIVCAGYKTPGDQNGEPWSDGRETFQGIPEAYSMSQRLVERHGIDPDRIKVEPYSFETVTNLVYSRGKLPDERPVGVAAHREQLDRITSIVLPAVFERPWMGLVVPELDDEIDHDSYFSRIASRLITTGLTPRSSDEQVRRQAKLVWDLALLIMRMQKASQNLPESLQLATENLARIFAR